jgi:hypothetical protein
LLRREQFLLMGQALLERSDLAGCGGVGRCTRVVLNCLGLVGVPLVIFAGAGGCSSWAFRAEGASRGDTFIRSSEREIRGQKPGQQEQAER